MLSNGQLIRSVTDSLVLPEEKAAIEFLNGPIRAGHTGHDSAGTKGEDPDFFPVTPRCIPFKVSPQSR